METLVVRPETLINQYYDEDWLPLLQTPPFPEYTSGHSVISAAAALTLTDLLVKTLILKTLQKCLMDFLPELQIIY